MAASKRFKLWEKIVAATAISGLLLFAVFVWYGNYAQKAADQAAEEYAARAEPLVAAEPSFKNVVVYRFSGYGCARIQGYVSTEGDLKALHKFIDATMPPRNIQMLWTVKIDPNPDPALKEGYPFPATSSSE